LCPLVAISLWLDEAPNDGHRVWILFSVLQVPVPEVNDPSAGRAVGALIEILPDHIWLDYLSIPRVSGDQLVLLIGGQGEAIAENVRAYERNALVLFQLVRSAGHRADWLKIRPN
jgi:hypothetical protein